MNKIRPSFKDKNDALVAGLEFSSQSVSWQVSHPEHGLVDSGSFSFEKHLPEVAGKGWLNCLTGDVITAPMLFVCGLDAALLQMQNSEYFDLKNIKVIAGAGQQHGQVFLKQNFAKTMHSLNLEFPLQDQLRDVWGRPWATMWMNSSTSASCAEFANFLPDGSSAIARITGSVPTERFFGPALYHIASHEQGYLAQTADILLISTLGASLLLGKPAPMEQGDGSGGNLMDLSKRRWSEEIFTAFEQKLPGVLNKLPQIIDANTPIGKINSYFVKRYGFDPSCELLPWTGDNCDSLLGRGVYSVDQGLRVNSKGTSETDLALVLAASCENCDLKGTLFAAISDIDSAQKQNIAITTFKNGTLALEKIMERHNLKSDFGACRELVNSIPPGNNGNFMIGFFEPEITPKVLSPRVEYSKDLDRTNAAQELRAILEFQAINRWLQTKWLESNQLCQKPKAYVLTGGAGVDRTVAQIDADVFGVPVYLAAQTNSVVNGACLRAMRQLNPELYSFSNLCTDLHCPLGERVDPVNKSAYFELKDLIGQRIAAI